MPGHSAYRIVEWDRRYEVDGSGRAWAADKPKRQSRLTFVRWPAWGFDRGEGYAEMLRAAKPDRAAAVFGLFAKLLEVAGANTAEKRGWIISSNDEALDPARIAAKLGWDVAGVRQDLETLCRIRWVEVAQCPFAVARIMPVVMEVTIADEPPVSGARGEPHETAAHAVDRTALCNRNRNETQPNKTKTETEAPPPDSPADQGPGAGAEVGGPTLYIEEGDRAAGLGGSEPAGPGDSGLGDSGLDDSGLGLRASGPGPAGSEGAKAPIPLAGAGPEAPLLAGHAASLEVEAIIELERLFPSLQSRRTFQARADYTTVKGRVRRVINARGAVGLEELMEMSRANAACPTLTNHLAAWTSAAEKILAGTYRPRKGAG